MRSGADTLDRIVFHLMFLGFEFEVHEPQELKDHVQAVIARLQNAIRVQE